MTNLTERYIYAATRGVPEKNRSDLTAELAASIRDAVDARVESGEARDGAERDVLNDLGDPDKLAAGYTDRPLHLIGPRYYFEWWRLLKLLLWIVPPVAALGIALGQVLSGAPIGEVIGSTVAGVLGVIVHLAFWVTLVFAILERNIDRSTVDGTAPPELWATWTVDRLPEIRAKGLGFGDMVASLVFLALAAAAILWDRFIGFVWSGDERMPVLDPQLWPWWIAGLFAIMAAEAAMAVAIYATGRWSPALAVLNAVLALAVAVPAIWLLANGQLINQEFFASVIPPDSSATVYSIVSVVTGFGIAAIAGWDIVDGILKTVRAGRRMPARS